MAQRERQPIDQRIGHNLRVMREQKNLSQSAIAGAMAAREHPWHQQTVARAEAGTRKFGVQEVSDLAEILGTTVDRLTWESQEAQATEFLYAAGYAVRTAHETVADAIRAHLRAIAHAERWAAQFEGHESARVREARLDALGRVEEYGLEDAITEGVHRFEKPGDPSE